jgi:3-hydroxyacyl-CoA dehydrogenase
MSPSAALERMIAEGRLGKKSGKGFYDHARAPRGRPEVVADFARFRPKDVAPLAPLDDEAIVDRAVLAMLNEAARALEEEVVAGPKELDLATVFGMGFPPFRGGLLRFADAVGLHAIAEKLARIASAPDVMARGPASERFGAAPSLSAMAAKVRRFHG